MKKIIVVVFSLVLLLTIIACDKETTLETSTSAGIIESTTDINFFETYGYEIIMLEYEDPYFDVSISDIEIDVLQREISFHYEIDDYSSSYDYYFVYGYETKTQRPFHQMLDREKAASGDYTLDMLIDDISTDKYMTIEMGRYSASNSINKEYPETNSVGFKYRIYDIESRGLIDDFNIRFKKSDSDSYHIANLDLEISDPDNNIQEIKLVLSEESAEGLFIEERTITIDSSNHDENGIDINGISFDGLAPSVRYNMDIYISGYDGLYDFNDLYFVRKQVQMEEGWFMETYQHGFYCQIFNSYQTNGTTYINLDLANTGTYKIDNQIPELYLNFYHSSSESEPYLSIRLDNESENIVLSNSSISIDDIIRVEDSNKTVILANASIHPN